MRKIESNVWSKPDITGTAPSPRAAFGIGVISSKLYIFGGRDTSQRVNDVHILDVEKLNWESPAISGIPFIN